MKHATTAEDSIDGIPFRVYAARPESDGGQCLTMEFASPTGTPREPAGACRDNLAREYVVNGTDFTSRKLPSGTGLMFSAVPNGTTSRIVYRPRGGGNPVELTLIPLPGTKFQAFYGFVEDAKGRGTVTFYDAGGKPYPTTWPITW